MLMSRWEHSEDEGPRRRGREPKPKRRRTDETSQGETIETEEHLKKHVNSFKKFSGAVVTLTMGINRKLKRRFIILKTRYIWKSCDGLIGFSMVYELPKLR
jgi:hypothetical protein